MKANINLERTAGGWRATVETKYGVTFHDVAGRDEALGAGVRQLWESGDLRADKFDESCELLVSSTWKDEGKAVFAAIDQAHKAKKPYKIEKVLPNYPNTKRHAEAFVDAVFGDYLKKS